MKRFSSLLSLIIITITVMTFTSCDRDADEADALLGIWRGQIEGNNSYTGYYDTEIRFYGNYATSGSGDEYDQDPVDPNNSYYSTFNWEVKDNTIYIYYDNLNDFRNVAITDYRFNSNYFEGYMNGYKFSLTKTVNWSDWHAKKAPAVYAPTSTKTLSDSTSTNK